MDESSNIPARQARTLTGLLRRAREICSTFSPSQWRFAAFLVFSFLVIVHAASFGIVTLRYEGRFSPDSIVYVDVARNVLAGNGLVSGLVPLDEALGKDRMPPAPMTMWAPGYPVLIAGLAKCGLSATLSALLIPVVFYWFTLAFAFLAMRRLSGLSGAMLAIAFLVAFFPLLAVARTAWSETMAMAFAMLFFWIAAREDGGFANALAMGVAAGVSFAARYAMLPLILVGAITCLKENPRRTVERFAALSAGFLAVSGPILLRNYMTGGRLLGEHVPRTMFGYGEVCTRISRVVWEGLCSCSPASLFLACVLFLTALGTACLQFRSRNLFAAMRAALWERKQYLLVVWVVVYVLLLVRSEVKVAIDPVNDRLLIPASVVALLLLAGLVASALRPRQWIAGVFAVMLLAIAALDGTLFASMVLRSKVPGAHVFDTTRSPLYSWISANVRETDLVIVEDCFQLPLYAGPFLMLYFDSQLPTVKPLRNEDLVSFLEKRQGGYTDAFLILRAGRGLRGPRPAEWGPFLNELDSRKDQDLPGFSTVAEFDDARVFRIEPPHDS